MSELKERLEAIKGRLQELGRPDVRIIAVTKTHGPELITRLLRIGLRDIGENRQNEARDKFPLVDLSTISSDSMPIYHHIGPLQSGSARQIPGLFHWVHGASNLSAIASLMKSAAHFAEELSEKKETPNKTDFIPIRYLIQLDLTGEKTKAGGITIRDLESWNEFPVSPYLIPAGFMTMGPESQDVAQTREVFHQCREIRDRLMPGGELSMGMSGDWEIAVNEGATMVRIGSALVGHRGPGPWKPGV